MKKIVFLLLAMFTAFYSMNWGEGGNYNGMYLDNAFYPGADYSNSRTDMYLNPLN